MKNLVRKIGWYLGIKRVEENSDLNRKLSINDFLENHLYKNSKYLNTKRLNSFEYSLFSQYGEDGILSEILNRINAKNKFFVEFGAGDGYENNTSALLLEGWEGVWMDGDKDLELNVGNNYKKVANQLKAKSTFITKENINSLFAELQVPKEFGVLSIDLDGNDYWIWKELVEYNPDVVVIEYNASLGPNVDWKMDYNPTHTYDGTNYFGASLKSLENLGKEKGYALVGCSFAGTNAFFVKNELIKDLFHSPNTSEEMYEPVRYFLYQKLGHKKSKQFFR